jgi:macrolide transport system ATP-binding/permease protein
MSVHVHSPQSALVARDVVRRYGDRPVLDGVDLVANPGHPLGLVGENGAGKSTLLRVVAGLERPDAGSLAVPADLGYLAQEPAFVEGATVADVLTRALAPLHDAVRRLEDLAGRLEDPLAQEEYAATLQWAEHRDAWDADRRSQAATAHLGLAELSPTQPVASLSGGQRMRLALAALLTRRPACVLLDEPTNHLDDAAMSFLEGILVDLPGVVVVASHDRTFLENVCSTIVDLDPSQAAVHGGARFSGGYSSYLHAKREARRRWEEAFAAHQEELGRLRRSTSRSAHVIGHSRAPRDSDKFIHYKQGQNVDRAVGRRVKDAQRRIEVLERDPVPKPPRPLTFRAPLTAGAPGVRVFGREVRVPGRLYVSAVDVRPGAHLLLTGANGSGKSTLLHAIAGVLDVHGHLEVSARRIGHLPQEVVFGRPDRSVRQVYDETTGAPVPLIDLGLVHPRDLDRPVGALSVGQQRRVALAILVARRPDLLLLDEPTNHISLALAEELEDAVQHATDSVIVASHDRWLRRRWAGPVLPMEN